MPTILLSLTLVAIGQVPADTESIDFIGFSRNQALAAYRLRVETPRSAGSRDRFGLIIVALMPERGVGAETVAIFRDSDPVRLDASGRRIRTATKRLLNDNARFAEAQPRSQWLALKRRARFRKSRLPLAESILRLAPDADAELEAHKGERTIDVVAPPNRPVGFDTVLRKAGGDRVSGGKFRMECPQEAQLEARIEAFHSRNGYSVAILTTFSVRSADGAHDVPKIAFTRMLHSPVGTTRVGTWNMAKENLRWGADWYNLRHPGSEDQYERFVGDKGTLRASVAP